jgi:hypothetical protein
VIAERALFSKNFARSFMAGVRTRQTFPSALIWQKNFRQ